MIDESDIFSTGLQILRRVGARITDGGLDSLTLVLSDRRIIPVEVHIWESSVRARPPAEGVRALHIARTASADAVAGAVAGQYELVTTDPPRVIVTGDVLLSEGTEDQLALRSAKRPGRAPWGRWAIERVLIMAREPVDQMTIAAATGLTQQAVSAALSRHNQVRRVGDGWLAAPGLLDDWLATYSGPAGHAMHWYSLDDPVDQAVAATRLAAELDVQILGAGDIAADWYQPWRRPATARLYVSEVVDFSPVGGFVHASAAEATMTVVIPKDPTLWRTATSSSDERRLRLVDPVIALWDLLHTSVGPDAYEAASRLRHAIEARTLHV